MIATPISEAGIVGMASGLALCGNAVVVEIMFGDFLGQFWLFQSLDNFLSATERPKPALFLKPIPVF